MSLSINVYDLVMNQVRMEIKDDPKLKALPHTYEGFAQKTRMIEVLADDRLCRMSRQEFLQAISDAVGQVVEGATWKLN